MMMCCLFTLREMWCGCYSCQCVSDDCTYIHTHTHIDENTYIHTHTHTPHQTLTTTPAHPTLFHTAVLLDPVDNTSRTPEGPLYPSACRALAACARPVCVVGAAVTGPCSPEGSNYRVMGCWVCGGCEGCWDVLGVLGFGLFMHGW